VPNATCDRVFSGRGNQQNGQAGGSLVGPLVANFLRKEGLSEEDGLRCKTTLAPDQGQSVTVRVGCRNLNVNMVLPVR